MVDTGDVIDGEGTDLSATILDTTTSIGVPLTTKTSDTDYGSDAGVELTLRSARQYDGAMYRVGSPDRVKVGVTNALPVASIETAYAQILPGGSMLATVTVEPAPISPISVGITADDNDGTGGYQVYQGGSVVTSVSVGTSGSAEIRVSASHITGGQLSSAGGTVSSLEVDLDTSSDYTIDPAKDDLSVSFAGGAGDVSGVDDCGASECG